VQQLACLGSDDVPADDPAGRRVAEDLDVAVGLAAAQRLAVLAEGVGRRQVRDTPVAAFPLRQPDAGTWGSVKVTCMLSRSSRQRGASPAAAALCAAICPCSMAL
jgi:hypothetical protein